uniref:Uncharacterized protein AlNc14C39G3366 n=1 Tax=Albugo laibachii Nc14 TaxID=890382 RepID=F0W999_9STRA|nr:hypothetical protein FG10081.1 [Albugo laibachii Nc14]CCA18358.1 hypothetical protein FG10081.1 [Albugo laibachii Nc14]|eukprot:CCA18358.1 hypothetical protein FG10081.1 [Albugo laibachii Nc14]
MYLVPLELLTRGQQAVHLFFVLSGFVLSVSFIAKLYNVEVISDSIQDDDVRSQKMKDVQYSGFLSISSTSCRRFARLFVPCFISGWIAFLSTEILNTHVDCAKLLNSDMLKDKGWLSRVCRAKASDTESTLLWKYIQIATIKVWDGGSVNPYNRAMWTMHVELAGSAIVMFTLLMVANIRWRYRTAALIAAFMFTFNASADQTTNDYSSFYSGMLIAQLIVYPPLVNFSLKAWRPQWLGVEWYGVVLQSGFAILGMYLLSVPYGADNGENRYSWVLKFFKPFGLDVVKAANRIGALIFMLVLAFSPGMQRFLTHRVFRFMGRISFLLYLLHFEVLMTVGVPVAYTMDIHDVLPYEHARYVASAVCVVVSVVAGYFATILIDEPVQRGLRLFEKRLKIVAR